MLLILCRRTLDIVPMLDSSISQLEDYCKKYCPGPTDDAISSTPLKPDRLVELENILDNLADHTRIATILVKKVGIGSLQVARQHHPEFIPCLDRLECLYISLTTVDFANPGPQVPIHDYPWICLILAITKFQIRMPDDSLFRLHVDRASEGEKGDWGMDYAPSHVGDKNDGGQPDNRLEGKRETRPNWIHRLKGLVEEIYGHTSVYYGGSDFFLRGSCRILYSSLFKIIRIELETLACIVYESRTIVIPELMFTKLEPRVTVVIKSHRVSHARKIQNRERMSA